MNTAWENTLYLTIDIDWACDAVLAHTLDLLEAEDLPATIFVTHDTPLLERMRQNPKLELGVHPNFNPLLNGEGDCTARQVLRKILQLVPQAGSVRSHALAAGSLLSSLFYEEGLRREANYYYFSQNKHVPCPHLDPSGMLRIQHFWEDDCHCAWHKRGVEPDWEPGRYLDYTGPKVFAFHPIHLFLNTEDLDRYERTRSIHRDAAALQAHVNQETTGSGYFFNSLVQQAKARGFSFKNIRDITLP